MGTIWEGKSQDLKHKAVGGMGAPRYELTEEFLFIRTGTLRSDAQQVRVVDIVDVDVRQSMTQKARSIGDVVVHVQRPGGGETVTLESVSEPRRVHELINEATRNRRIYDQHQANVYTHAQPVPQQSASAPPPPPAGPPPGWYADPQNSAIQRWWDGGRWTEHTQPGAPTA